VQVVKALASVQQTLDQQHDLVQQILVSQKNSEKTAKQALTVAKAGAARLGKLDKDVKQLKRAAVESKSEVAAVKAQMAALQSRIDQQTEIERRLAALEARDSDGT
jgi:predicted RNase H-like nuclease (RuvC/YqgF family)